jgi:O-antigen ligase
MNALSSAEAAAIDGRCLPATGAAAIAVSGIFSLGLSRYWQKGLASEFIPIVYLALAIYLRHRTVWLMLLVAMAALLPLDASLFRRLLPAALIAGALVTLLVIYGSDSARSVGGGQFSESATNTQTLEWRVNGWKELLFDEEQNPLTIAIGKSMGSGNWRIDPVSYRALTVAPHSEYLQEYLRVGVIGALLMLLFGLRPLLKLWRLTKINPTAVYPSTSAWAIIVLATLVYGVTYGIGPHSYALLGIANAIATRRRALEEATASAESESNWTMTTAQCGIAVEI